MSNQWRAFVDRTILELYSTKSLSNIIHHCLEKGQTQEDATCTELYWYSITRMPTGTIVLIARFWKSKNIHGILPTKLSKFKWYLFNRRPKKPAQQRVIWGHHPRRRMTSRSIPWNGPVLASLRSANMAAVRWTSLPAVEMGCPTSSRAVALEVIRWYFFSGLGMFSFFFAWFVCSYMLGQSQTLGALMPRN